jgi:hypothetical protein
MLKRAGHSVISAEMGGLGADAKVVLTNGEAVNKVKDQVTSGVLVIRAKRNDGQTLKEVEAALAERARLAGA